MHRTQVRQTVAALASVALALGCSVVSRVPSAGDPENGSSATVQPAASGADSSVPEGPVLRPEPGYHAISVTLLTGHMFEERYRNYYSAFWNLKPVARAGYSMYLYKIDPPQTGPSGR
jgi:hypothetical protein